MGSSLSIQVRRLSIDVLSDSARDASWRLCATVRWTDVDSDE